MAAVGPRYFILQWEEMCTMMNWPHSQWSVVSEPHVIASTSHVLLRQGSLTVIPPLFLILRHDIKWSFLVK